jgi:hypothetical protein
VSKALPRKREEEEGQRMAERVEDKGGIGQEGRSFGKKWVTESYVVLSEQEGGGLLIEKNSNFHSGLRSRLNFRFSVNYDLSV